MGAKRKTPSRRQIEAKVVAKAWSSATYRARLIRNPAAVLKDEGLDIPPGVKVKVHQNTAKVINMVLPAKPAFRAKQGKRPKPPSRIGPTLTMGH